MAAAGPCLDWPRASTSGGHPCGWLGQLRRRELTGHTVQGRPFLGELSCDGPGAGTVEVNPDGRRVPPLVIRYNQVQEGCKYLAVADEEGYISIIDTFAELPGSLFHCPNRPRGQWLAHNNAVFDLAWSKCDSRMLTGSGDQSVGVWDTLRASCISHYRGHEGSIKTVCFHPEQHHIFASGARDGAALIWDTRSGSSRTDPRTGSQESQPILSIQDAHRSESERRKYRRPSHLPARHIKHGVTSAFFLNQGNMLATAGDKDGVVKLWDTRMLRPTTPHVTGRGQKVACVASIGCPAWGERPHGITSLVQSPREDCFLVSISQGPHLLYSSYRPEQHPIAVFSGHSTNSFYVKACFSGDGTHILSGSGDKRAHIYEVARPAVKYTLEGHSGEVTSVAWCPSDITRLASCGDDCVIRCWNLPSPQQGLKASDIVVAQQKSVCNYGNSVEAAGATASSSGEMAPLTPTLCSQKQRLDSDDCGQPESLSARETRLGAASPALHDLPPFPSVTAWGSYPPRPARATEATAATVGFAGTVGPCPGPVAMDTCAGPSAGAVGRQATGNMGGAATVHQSSRVCADWQTPPASSKLQVVGAQDGPQPSAKRRCLSTGGKLVQRSLCDFLIPAAAASARPLRAPRPSVTGSGSVDKPPRLSLPAPGGTENRQPVEDIRGDLKHLVSPRSGARQVLKDMTMLGQDIDYTAQQV